MKIGALYDLDTFKKFKDSAKAVGFKDAEAGVILARNLTAVDPKVFEKRYPELSFLNSGISVDNSGGYARRIQSLRIVEQGTFADASDLSDTRGKISLAGEDSFLKVFPKEAHSIWTEDDVKEAEMQNINLVQRYVATHNKAYNQKVDEIGYLGHNGQEGLLNHSSFTSTNASGLASALTGQQLYDEIATVITEQRNAVNNTPEYSCDTVSLPISVFNIAQSKILNSAGSTKTVLTALRENFPDINFVSTFRSEDVGGASKTVAYSTHEEAMKMRIPVRLTVGEIIKATSFSYRVDSKFRIAGLDVLEGTSGRILSGL